MNTLLKTNMRQFVTGLVGLVGLVAAQSGSLSDASVSSTAVSSGSSSLTSSTSSSSASLTGSPAASSTSSSLASSSTSIASSASTTSKPTAVTVAADGSAQFTAINAAIAAAQNSAIPTVSVLSGMYSESIIIQGTQTVTIVGPTASSYVDNQVVIAAAATNGVVSFNTQNSNGITLRNVNITNTGSSASTKAPAFNAYGSNMLLDTVALVSGGTAVYQAGGFGTTLISNSYIEGKKALALSRSYTANVYQVPISCSTHMSLPTSTTQLLYLQDHLHPSAISKATKPAASGTTRP